jgi:hypothetical protein
MKKIAYLLLAALLLGCSQKTTAPAEQEPPITSLDVESLYQHLDMDMDITGLSVSDLHILSNVFLAQKGYPFEDSYLRGIYGSTTWYDSLMWEFDAVMEAAIEDLPEENWDPNKTYRENYYGCIAPQLLELTDEQQAFVNRVKEREAELLKLNFKPEGDGIVNIQNIINPGLIKETDQQLWNYLGANGFAIVPAKHQQLFHVYEQNDYHEFPAFVTTDLFLQLYHLYFDCMLRELEAQKFDSIVKQLCEKGYQHFDPLYQDEDARWLSDYFAIARFLTGKAVGLTNHLATVEIDQVMAYQDSRSEFLGYDNANFPYSLFKPRGHYTRGNLQSYFRTMMWLQTVPFRTDDPRQMKRAVMLADWLNKDTQAQKLYETIAEPLTYLMGQPDNVSIPQVMQIVKKTGLDIEELVNNQKQMQAIRQQVEQLAKKQTRIKPKFNYSGEYKINLMPQRYQPDAEVLQEMVDYESKTTKRGVPTGLDVFAAMGVSSAEKILVNEIGEPDRWNKYTPTLKRMKERMKSIQWDANGATQWMSALKTISEKPQNAPYFMMTGEWDKKSLNAMLASWTELKHDAILYAKQPMGAECGGAGPPDPIVKGYVEPNILFWQKAIDLLKKNKALLERYGLLTPKISDSNERLIETAEFFLTVSKKELKGEILSEEEYDQLEYIGAKFENMSLELISTGEENLYEWNAVQGTDRRVALVADVYTANADNNPKKSILFEGVGDADEIYVIVEIGGYLYLTRGAVFSYREFQRPTSEQRLNDEEWQQYIDSHPRYGVPEWMQPIIVPMDQAPVDNESVFYSSGC